MLKASLLMIILIFVSKIKYPDILLKYIFYLFILSITIEYLLVYLFEYNIELHFTRYGYIRPLGISGNTHLTTLFI